MGNRRACAPRPPHTAPVCVVTSLPPSFEFRVARIRQNTTRYQTPAQAVLSLGLQRAPPSWSAHQDGANSPQADHGSTVDCRRVGIYPNEAPRLLTEKVPRPASAVALEIASTLTPHLAVWEESPAAPARLHASDHRFETHGGSAPGAACQDAHTSQLLSGERQTCPPPTM